MSPNFYIYCSPLTDILLVSQSSCMFCCLHMCPHSKECAENLANVFYFIFLCLIIIYIYR